MPPHQLPIFGTLLQKRGRVWRWSVCTAEGRVVMLGGESRRASARYKANRALFLTLTCAPYSYVHLRNGDSRSGQPFWSLTFQHLAHVCEYLRPTRMSDGGP